jgi:Kringle domain.
LSFTEAEFPSSGTIFEYSSSGKRGFRCDHYYEDGSCWGGPDGGGCSKRKKREELVSRPPEDIVNISRSLSARQKRQTDDVIGCQKESTNGVDYRGRAAETVDGVACMKWTEGVINPPSTTSEHNFCRNPTDDPNGVWCNTGPSSTGYCNVPKCNPVITTRDVSCSEWVGGRAYWKWDYEIPNTCARKFELQPCSEHSVIQLKAYFRGLMSEGRTD